MQATSAPQFQATTTGTVPGLEEVRERLYCYGLAQPGTLPHYSLSYLLIDAAGAVHIIDPGWNTDENWDAFTATLAQLDRSVSDVASVTVTHLHPDHLGLAERMRAASGALVALHAAEQDGIRELSTPTPDEEILANLSDWGVPADRVPELVAAAHRRSQWASFTADRFVEDGDTLEISGHSVRALHTPGHTSGHLAFVDDVHRVIFLGDHLLPNQFPGIGLGGTAPGNPIDHYLASLDTVASFADFEALPGHAYRFTGIAERCAETAKHHETRTREVAAIRHPDATVWDLAGALTWTAGWGQLSGLPLLSALSQTALHEERAGRSSTR